jgi:hypothetical protein
MRKHLPILTGALALVAVVAVAFLAFGGSDDKKRATTSAKAGTTVSKSGVLLKYPKGWKPLSKQDLGNRKGVVGIKRADDTGLMVVQQRGRLTGGLTKTAKDLGTLLDKRFPDYKFVGAKKVALPQAGTALSFTFLRTQKGQVQNIVVVPDGKRSYTLNSIVAGDKAATAKDVAKIVQTFNPGA